MVLPALVVAFLMSAPPPPNPHFFDIPEGRAAAGMYAFLHGLNASFLFVSLDFERLTTHPVHGVFTPCDAFLQMTAGLDILIIKQNNQPLCQIPPPPTRHKARPPLIDPPRCVRCLEISGIPIPWCEDDRGSLLNDHGCVK